MLRSGIHAGVIASVVVIFATLAALGQGTTGSILGTVYDQSKAVMPGVTVTATERDTGHFFTVPDKEIGDIKVLMTVLGGKVVYSDAAFGPVDRALFKLPEYFGKAVLGN